jgi:hypothetical protein
MLGYNSSDESSGRNAEILAQPLGLFLADCALAIDGVRDAAARTKDRNQIGLPLA